MTAPADPLERLLPLLDGLSPEEVEEVVGDLSPVAVTTLLQGLGRASKDRYWEAPGALAQEFLPDTRQTPALQLIDEALVRTHAKQDSRLIISMPPQEGKSQRASRWFPLWVLAQDNEARIAIASYEGGVARRWGRSIRDDIAVHGQTLGISVRKDMASQTEWQLEGHEGGIFTTGIGGSLTGRPVDLLIIDDPIKDRIQADSETYRDRAWDWWRDVASTRLAPGAPVVLILTRWHHDDLAGRLLAAEDGHLWEVVNIPAQADHRPEEGEEDPLGREPGEFMLSARGRSNEQWEAIKVRSGPRTWASLYQGRPSPAEGSLFPATWSRFEEPLWVERPDGSRWVPEGSGDLEMIQSWDMTFKDQKASDYVVGQVWLRQRQTIYLLDQVRARMDFTRTLEAVQSLTARWPQASAKFVEDSANGPAVINALQRSVPGLIPVEPEGSKFARASAVAPFAHSGNIVLPSADLLPNVEDLIEEARGFPAAKHDDTIDTLSQAANRLLWHPLTSLGEGLTSDDLADRDGGFSYLTAY